MFGLFKKKKYRPEILSKVSGEAHGIQVSFINYPVRVLETEPEQRIEFYPDFNSRLMHAIWKKIEDFDSFIAKVITSVFSIQVTVENAPTFTFEIQIAWQKSKRDFTAELADAVINAFEREKIGR